VRVGEGRVVGKGKGVEAPRIHISGYATEKWPAQSENRDDVPVCR